MRSFELCESPLRADHMTTKALPSPREHTCTLGHFRSENHTGTHVHFGQTLKRISAPMHQFGFAAALLLCRIQCNPSTLALQACRLNICSRGQQEHPLSEWHSLPTEMQAPDTRLVAQAGCHKWGSREAKKAVLFICLFIYLYLWGATAVTRVLSQR